MVGVGEIFHCDRNTDGTPRCTISCSGHIEKSLVGVEVGKPIELRFSGFCSCDRRACQPEKEKNEEEDPVEDKLKRKTRWTNRRGRPGGQTRKTKLDSSFCRIRRLWTPNLGLDYVFSAAVFFEEEGNESGDLRGRGGGPGMVRVSSRAKRRGVKQSNDLSNPVVFGGLPSEPRSPHESPLVPLNVVPTPIKHGTVVQSSPVPPKEVKQTPP
ncbi:hypothetical protein DVH24_014650 [Malus domestica]|uniref:Uncharacterized protein n=1 Tax=Malus domestica TaxID=3750 RepID=A0A498KNT0_MALDO|nr:hypothetical protein DVH24_014650 [Malus domestica]